MSVDILQEKIRKLKNPTVVELSAAVSQLPAPASEEESVCASFGRNCRELLARLRETVPAVRVSFSAFALQGAEGIHQLQQTLLEAKKLGYYVLLDAPEILSPAAAENTAQLLLGEDSAFFCNGVVIGGYLGSDVIKPFLPYCKKKKSVFVVARTGNKSASELQDLLSGTRQVHAAAADHVNRHGVGTAGKYNYNQVGILAAASSADSLKSLRTKYPGLFLLVDGLDYPNANAKNCSFAFDKFGHGAAVCSGGIIGAWKQEDEPSQDRFLDAADAAALRVKKNLCRYISVL